MNVRSFIPSQVNSYGTESSVMHCANQYFWTNRYKRGYLLHTEENTRRQQPHVLMDHLLWCQTPSKGDIRNPKMI